MAAAARAFFVLATVTRRRTHWHRSCHHGKLALTGRWVLAAHVDAAAGTTEGTAGAHVAARVVAYRDAGAGRADTAVCKTGYADAGARPGNRDCRGGDACCRRCYGCASGCHTSTATAD